jgi:Immunoglobulin domain
MESMRKSSNCWLREAAIYMLFFVFLTNKSYAGLGLPPAINAQPSDTTVSNADTATFSTTVALSLTPLKFNWLFNGKPIVTNSNITVQNSALLGLLGIEIGVISELTIHTASPTNAGNYSVQIQNGGGSVTSGNASLTVLTNTVSSVVNILSAGTGMTANGFKIQLSGPSGSNYVIQASSDLKNWIPISTNAAPTGSISYTDAAATNLSFRYYRAMIQ